VIIGPVVALNLYGTQITGKSPVGSRGRHAGGRRVPGDRRLDAGFRTARCGRATGESPTPITWISPFHVTALWIGNHGRRSRGPAGGWSTNGTIFHRSRDIGLLSAAWQLWARADSVCVSRCSRRFPWPRWAADVGADGRDRAGQARHWSAVLHRARQHAGCDVHDAERFFFMAEGQGAGPFYAQAGARYRRRSGATPRGSVPWGGDRLSRGVSRSPARTSPRSTLSSRCSRCGPRRLYLVIAIFFLRMRASKTLERPLEVKYGVSDCMVLLRSSPRS